jgi:hypothetical protein
VRGVEKLDVPESAKSTLVLIGLEDTLPKGPLVQPDSHRSRDVCTSDVSGFLRNSRRFCVEVGQGCDVSSVVDHDGEH